MTTVQLQTATPDQAEAMLAVLVASFDQYRQTLDPPSGVFQETPDHIRQKLAGGGGFVAHDDARMVGLVLYQPYPDHVYLGRLGVLPDYRGHQIATQLVNAVEQAAREQNLHRSQLCVRLSLTGNQQFFQRLGYAITEYRSHENYTEYTYVVMEKALSEPQSE